ncbi:hypothetical protein [Natrononativus amylolyticus]|uniref:hypothetical protein n=1 Tax=Natrononativus amylolyticus TaxID=2963434 RepID=UPI0020CC0C0E|nr:hypothetical protein [Natrononativus amylolyticus]
MALQRLLSGDPARSATLYIAIGVLSLLKAIAVRNDRVRFRRELLDAGLFLAVGLALRQYSSLKEEKRRELNERLPDWMIDDTESESAGLKTRAKRRLGGESEPEPDPTLRDRAKRAVGDRR